tara:strand:+ start:1884 stop:2327 length:444 start_codon:yes stop_codon:yes gene_type:complete
MSYLYIKQSQFDINNVIIKTNNDKLILNYNIPDANITLKNIIFKIRSKVVLHDSSNTIRIILDETLYNILNNMDNKIKEQLTGKSLNQYVSIVNRSDEYNYINIYINNINNMDIKDKKIIESQLLVKFKLINDNFFPRLYTYNMELY